MPKDNFPKAESMALARNLRHYWRRRGYEIDIRAVPIEADPSLTGKKRVSGWTIKTDMVGGWPKELAIKRTPDLKLKGGRLA